MNIEKQDVYLMLSIPLFSTGHWIGGSICIVQTLLILIVQTLVDKGIIK